MDEDRARELLRTARAEVQRSLEYTEGPAGKTGQPRTTAGTSPIPPSR